MVEQDEAPLDQHLMDHRSHLDRHLMVEEDPDGQRRV